MKIFAFLFSLVVITLSVAPCCALEDHLTQSEVKIDLKQQTNQTEDCCQECSPFYTCGTCGGFMVTPIISVSIETATLIANSSCGNYLQSFADGINQNIWQPPKIV